MKFYFPFFFCTLTLLKSFVLGEVPTASEFIHEAYISPIRGTPILEAAPVQPPPPITERIIPRPQATWISGYWIWSTLDADFIWVTGVWRNPPPGMQWISSQWIQMEEGWVRLRGFWSSLPLSSLNRVQTMPPDQIDENAGDPPEENLFWRSGFWEYSNDLQQYRWVSGSWEEFDRNWILVPAHYEWRPQGYIMIPAYWDWPLELRGDAFTPVSLKERSGGIFEPQEIETAQDLIPILGLYYPDYMYLIMHHYHLHPDAWKLLAPPWWDWKSWWGFSWQNQWALWWWYTHPGYPQPKWVTSDIAQKVSPPTTELLNLAKKVTPPLIVTQFAVISPNEIMNVMQKAAGTKRLAPVFPANRKKVMDALSTSLPKKLEPNKILYPIGPRFAPGKRSIKDQPKIPINPIAPRIPVRQFSLPPKPSLPSLIPFPPKKIEQMPKIEVKPQALPSLEEKGKVLTPPKRSVIKPEQIPPSLDYPGVPKTE